MWKGPYLLALSGGILLSSMTSAHALEITVQNGSVSIKTDEAKSTQESDGGRHVPPDGKGISIGNVTSDKQETGIHRSTYFENVTIIEDGQKTTYIKHGTKEGEQKQ